VGLPGGLGFFGHVSTLADNLMSEVAQQKLFIDSLKSLYKRYSFGYFYGFVAINPPKTA
jgi:hypothetical protein